MVEPARQEDEFASNIPAEVTPDYVRSLTAPTDTFLCRLSDNTPRM